ncbi:hypothetical protein K1T71_001438 [Dendrolimus kikuchii]|uniref:Uncharacterized protein n=1 Tax=Dendrolimus kikuchii TaxID=765133 RepID=A0ACC1DIM1_9NEOP|nr:hypothetical protein K1T71_001438 [Dendrolimus kikuchii]
MNRNQRRLGKTPKKNDSESKVKTHKGKNLEIQEVFTSPKAKKESPNFIKSMTNRCCFVSPNQQDFGQLTESDPPIEQNLIYEQYGIVPEIPDTITQLKELKKELCSNADKVENSSQYVTFDQLTPVPAYVETSDGSQWQNIENIDDIDKLIMTDKLTQKGSLPLHYPSDPKNIHISEVPRVKIIAKKFSRCKKNNIEVRKLDEKVVCLEYDIFDESDLTKPIQVMRAFFSIKPVQNEDKEGTKNVTETIPSDIRRNFKIADDDLKSLNEKEVEIIDGKIAENKPYLEDLKNILRRKKIHVKCNKNSLDLMSLYEMAKRERSASNYSDNNTLTKAELKEVKDLILAKCTSSVYGVSRRTIKGEIDEINLNKSENIGVISQSIFAELLREDAKTNVFQ